MVLLTFKLITLGLVDALELFAGLITFADSKAEDKLRCKKNAAYYCSPV